MCAHEPNIQIELYANGECKICDRERLKRYAKRRKLAMALLHTAEARGLSGGEAIAALQNISYWELQKCQESGIQ